MAHARHDHVESATWKSNGRTLVGITLSCGHVVTTRNPPMNDRAKFSCPAGKGHGYRLWWVQFERHDTGFTKLNDLYAQTIATTSEGEA